MSTKFQIEDPVIHRQTNQVGKIENVLACVSDMRFYRVRFAGGGKKVSEDELARLQPDEVTIESLAKQGRWGSMDTVRCAVAVERILQSNESTVYAFRNQRVLFQPYQYKPLLKFIESPDRKLLIADEVGLGKTIEAGLILTELEARQAMDAVLVVCPSRLRNKWQNELNRKFDQDFEIYDLSSLRQMAERYRERSGKVKLRGIVSMQTMRSPQARDLLTGVIGSLDLVIVDEAHHARNPSAATHELLQDLCEISDSTVLLSATPVQLGNQDLFSLLNAMRPEEFRELRSFEQQIEHYAPLHDASALARSGQMDNASRIATILQEVCVDGQAESLVDPLALQLIDRLQHCPPETRAEWITVERQIQDLHPLGTILTRSRKREVVENAPKREACTITCDWTAAEDEAYQRLVAGMGSRGWPNGQLGFAQIQRARQAASCLPAAFEAQRRRDGLSDDPELSDILREDLAGFRDPDDTGEVVDDWNGTDSKYEKFSASLGTIWKQEPDAKLIVFTYFKGTARYLEKRLNEQGIEVLRIDGDVPSEPRKPERDERGKRLARFKNDPAVKVLVSTEVGSEGLDFQFCHHLVNYDLPWNPMVLEQRIGRIDRFGQQASKIFIHNLVVRGTVEDRILTRLYDRIGIFKRSIGVLESILGDQTRKLQLDYLRGELDPDTAQQLADQAADAIIRQQQHLEELAQNAGQLFGHEQYVREQVDRVSSLGQFLSEKALLGTLKIYLKTFFPSTGIKQEGSGVYELHLTDELRMDIQASGSQSGLTWIPKSTSDIVRFTFDGELAFADEQLELLNPQHPIIRAAVTKLQSQLTQPTARLGAAELVLAGDSPDDYPPGNYVVAVAPLDVQGVRARRLLEVAAYNIADLRMLPADQSARLLFQAMEDGIDFKPDQDSDAIFPSGLWDDLETEFLARVQSLKQREEQENTALVVRRRRALDAEFERKIAIKEQRLVSARRNSNTKMVKPFQGQVDKARAAFQTRREALDKQQSVSVMAGDVIALCLVRVRNA